MDVDRVRAELELTRREIAHTIDELQARLAVRTLARNRVEDVQKSAAHAYAAAKAAAPDPVRRAMSAAEARSEPLRDWVRAEPRRAARIAGAGLLALIVLRRLRASARPASARTR